MMDRISAIRQNLKISNLDAALISSYENWRYFSGFTGSHAYLVITSTDQVLITDPRYTEQATQQAIGWKIITHGLDAMPSLQQAFESSGVVTVGYETQKISDFEIGRLRGNLPEITWIPMEDIGKQLRAVKNNEESANIRQAIRIADLAVEELTGIVIPGMTERDVAIELDYRLAKHGSEGPAFGTIVATGPRGALPHATPSDQVITPGDMIVVDCGATYHGYRSDITRTLWVGDPIPRMREIFDVVLASQQAAQAVIRPGITGGEVDFAHREVFRKHNLEQYSLRGLGHGVGLEIHELPRVVMDTSEVIQTGMIFTVEPGLYLPGIGGVRIEDMVEVTQDGCEILTRCPKVLRIPAAAAVEES